MGFAEAQVHESAGQLEFVHRTAGLTSWIWEVSPDRVTWYGDVDALLGLPAGGFSGRFEEYLSRLHPQDIGASRRTYVECLKGLRPTYRSEERLLRADGAVRWVETFGRGEYRDGRAVRLAGVVRDITDRRAAEQRVRELADCLEERVRARTAELEAANRELERFGLAVSHDLRAPATTIVNFAELLERECGTALCADGLQYLVRIRRIAARMGGMVDGLLELSRAARGPMACAPVDLAGAATELAEELRPVCRFNGDVVIEALPPARGDPRLLRQVLQNLLSNAMKFSRHVPSPQVRLAVHRRDAAEAEYAVQDNGCGFDMQHAGVLFGTFQRLHRGPQYEGSGVGLATVRRIVERHGGRVRAEGRAGEGATFYFTLPLA